mgnify:CR=1 FL=1
MAALRREALESAPLSFGSSVEDDRFRSVQAIEQALGREDGHVYGLFLGPALVGMTGVYRTTSVKEAHKAFVWGMYVRPGARRRGGATRLLAAAVACAKQWPDILQIHLCVTDSAPQALQVRVTGIARLHRSAQQ